MFGKDLVVMAEFDGHQNHIDEIDSILIWVRVLKVPLGLMNKTDGELIGEMIGEVMEVDADDADMAIGLVTLDLGEGPGKHEVASVYKQLGGSSAGGVVAGEALMPRAGGKMW
jgi:hypothetical protein